MHLSDEHNFGYITGCNVRMEDPALMAVAQRQPTLCRSHCKSPGACPQRRIDNVDSCHGHLCSHAYFKTSKCPPLAPPYTSYRPTGSRAREATSTPPGARPQLHCTAVIVRVPVPNILL